MDNNTKTYVCTGTCGAHITQEEYEGGLTSCGTEGCSMKGHPFAEENPQEHGTHTVVTEEKDEDVVVNN